MKHTVSATELVRRLGDILGRVRYRRETFLIERNGRPVARLTPVDVASPATPLGEALSAWCERRDPSFADDLERVGAADRAPANPWGS